MEVEEIGGAENRAEQRETGVEGERSQKRKSWKHELRQRKLAEATSSSRYNSFPHRSSVSRGSQQTPAGHGAG
eukprot:1945575-Rhodomonas_salina.2